MFDKMFKPQKILISILNYISSDSNAYYSDKLVDQPEEVLVDIIHQLEQQLIRDRTHDLMEK